MNDLLPTPPIGSPAPSNLPPLPPSVPNLEYFTTSFGAELHPLKVIGKSPHDAAIRRISDIPYACDDPKQKLDIYFPAELAPTTSRSSWSNPPPRSPVPVFIHVHGGGWARGGKGKVFYGAPPLCEAQAAKGCISVAPGYRLMQHPDFLHDVALSFKWVKDNISKIGGDDNNVFLSGHSAGAHIISLLLIRFDDYLA